MVGVKKPIVKEVNIFSFAFISIWPYYSTHKATDNNNNYGNDDININIFVIVIFIIILLLLALEELEFDVQVIDPSELHYGTEAVTCCLVIRLT